MRHVLKLLFHTEGCYLHIIHYMITFVTSMFANLCLQ